MLYLCCNWIIYIVMCYNRTYKASPTPNIIYAHNNIIPARCCINNCIIYIIMYYNITNNTSPVPNIIYVLIYQFLFYTINFVCNVISPQA
jgi:hypothetical protein